MARRTKSLEELIIEAERVYGGVDVYAIGNDADISDLVSAESQTIDPYKYQADQAYDNNQLLRHADTIVSEQDDKDIGQIVPVTIKITGIGGSREITCKPAWKTMFIFNDGPGTVYFAMNSLDYYHEMKKNESLNIEFDRHLIKYLSFKPFNAEETDLRILGKY